MGLSSIPGGWKGGFQHISLMDEIDTWVFQKYNFLDDQSGDKILTAYDLYKADTKEIRPYTVKLRPVRGFY